MSLTNGPLDVVSEPDRPALTDIVARGDTLDRLAKRLYEIMERLDPTHIPSWECVADLDKEFYRTCVKAVVIELREILKFQR
jgi:hypothetical protein